MNIRIIKNFIMLIRYNIGTLIIFEIFHKGLLTILIWPLIELLIDTSITRLGYVYLVTENIIKVLSNPLTIIFIAISFIIIGIYMFFEITAVIVCIDEARRSRKIRVSDLIVTSFKRSLIILKPKNILLFIFVLIIIPITNLGLTSGVVSNLKFPEYILEYIYSNIALSIIYIIIIIFLYILVSRWVFSIYEVILNTKSFNKAIKESLNLTKGKGIKIILYSILLFMMISLIGILIRVAGVILIGLWTKYITEGSELRGIFTSRCMVFSRYCNFIGGMLGFLTGITFFLTVYYDFKGIEIFLKKETVSIKRRIFINVFKAIIILIGINIEAGVFLNNSKGISNLDIFYNTTAIAHRGNSTFAPENTMAAFKEAVDSKAEYAELDVQETKDGQLVVTHDSNFKRTAGVNRNVWEVRYDEIKAYDVGSYFDDKYKGEKVPTLEEVLKFSKGKIRLLIEVKIHGHEKDNVVKKVLDLIKENKMSNQCIIGSMDRKILQEVKQVSPIIKTCYITAVAYGNFYNWDYIDIYSIESTFVNKMIVDNIHGVGKQVFVWTVNEEENMERLLDMNVDSIITDDPYLVLDSIYWRKNNFIKELSEYFFKSEG